MVEEFMLLANCSTAMKTLEEFPDCAMLRRHPSPPASNFDPIVKIAESKVTDQKLFTAVKPTTTSDHNIQLHTQSLLANRHTKENTLQNTLHTPNTHSAAMQSQSHGFP